MDDEFANEIEEGINDYLVEAGLRRRPAGYRWFQTVPDGIEPGDISRTAIKAEARASKSSHSMVDAVPAIRQALRRLYRTVAD